MTQVESLNLQVTLKTSEMALIQARYACDVANKQNEIDSINAQIDKLTKADATAH